MSHAHRPHIRLPRPGRSNPGRRARRTALIAGIAASLVTGTAACSPLYVIRAGIAEARLLASRKPIAKLVSDPATPAPLRARLELALSARRFAKDSLGLRVGKSYTTYARVNSDTLMLVLSAARKDRFQQLTWWFPIVGRVPYKGYFDKAKALQVAAGLERKGYDAYVRPTTAFSTLGWFSDPLLSTIVDYGDPSLVETIIHELTHNTLYLPSQAAFNESLAEFVGNNGAIDYFCQRANAAGDDGRADGAGAADSASADATYCAEAREDWHDELIFGGFLEDLVHRLEHLYADTALGEATILKRRQVIFDAAKQRFRTEVQPQFKRIDYESFLTMPLNNATLIARRLYYDRLERFEAAYHREHDDLRATVAAIVAAAKADPHHPYAALETVGRKGAPAPAPVTHPRD